MVYGTTDEFLRIFGLNKISELPDLQEFAAKALREKQEELPFGEPLPPLAEPAIIPLDELEGREKLEALASSSDPFFTRNSYNRGDIFTQDATPDALMAAAAEQKAQENGPAQEPPQGAASDGEPSAQETSAPVANEDLSREEK